MNYDGGIPVFFSPPYFLNGVNRKIVTMKNPNNKDSSIVIGRRYLRHIGLGAGLLKNEFKK